MKSFAKWFLLPCIAMLALAFVTASDAEAHRWGRRYYRPAYYRAPAVAYRAPAAVYVGAPAVSVHVARPAVGVYRYGGPAVVVPPRIVTPWFQMW